MKTPALMAGKEGGGQLPASCSSCNTIRVSAADLRHISDLPGEHRFRVVYFSAPPLTLPNGLPRPQRIKAACAFRLAGGFHGRARVEREAGGPVLVVEAQALDLFLGRDVAMPYSLSLLRALYTEIGRCYILEQARQQSRKARN